MTHLLPTANLLVLRRIVTVVFLTMVSTTCAAQEIRNPWRYGEILDTKAEHKDRDITSIAMVNGLQGSDMAAEAYSQATTVEGQNSTGDVACADPGPDEAPDFVADANRQRRPDMVIFLSDDHTVRDSSVYGSPDIQTPNMARLAACGMVFDRAYVASPSCAPSRAALLTGLYPA